MRIINPGVGISRASEFCTVIISLCHPAGA